ncbi:protein-L-isoaspartate(D-aspartate) O-methyltransferase [Paraburkholderia sp. DD10]|uniref:protein-L-isoaspartate(D-aspartate) O-methyltransferase n=1 Tax=Paraburkholderia TaxID=1822464 RepID=UPI0009F4078B|nr:protein-L-isoaspartate(D-aspartate) O-methyltransferase [Paraburkholderia terricola]ORC49955.1 protein-L-isoaspartate O-methyltransferase [Burkholderia sp. A27]
MTNLPEARELMVERQIAGRSIGDPNVLAAMRRVPREEFVPAHLREFAYDDTPLPIAEQQTISQPYIVARMIEAAQLRPGDRVLEIGTGSGYAAAIAAAIAAHVDTVERHAALAQSARETLARLGIDNVTVHTGDGTHGLPEGAPYDAIFASAGGPHVPRAWREQLALGGRLIMPVGHERYHQRLVKVVRRTEHDYDERTLGAVMFVPLIGDDGWPAEDVMLDPPAVADSPTQHARAPDDLAAAIRAAAEPFTDFDSAILEYFTDRFAARRVVLLGEASHGTAEFYRLRAAITRRLIEEHGFSIVALEADWPDAAALDRHVRNRPPASGREAPFRRFPTWMWRNTDVKAFTDWLRGHNATLPQERQARLYGLDIYSLSESIDAVLRYLDSVDPAAARIARERYGCFGPWQKDPAVYGRAALEGGYAQCEQHVVAQLQDLLRNRLDYAEHDGETFFDASQNARLVASAERYYRAMYYGGAHSWNLRDTHMFETLRHTLDARGPHARAVVWAHNSHIGDASATEMGRISREINVGQLCREYFGDEAALIGFGTHAGTVAAASDWDGPMEVKEVRPALDDSYEYWMHRAGQPRFLLDLRPGVHDALRARLSEPLLERFIGVIYRPDTERYSHYAQASLADQFDAYVWVDRTSAVEPLPTPMREGTPDTFPFGV